ncbi:MAG: rRNA maturation RNase YbeY [Epsilonproteobacteria bacterium]|nr:rRNA maturation RNase YbeY [Campylobacterota bacterium]
MIIENRSDLELPLKLLEKIAKELNAKELELIILSDEEIQELNHKFRGINKPTDVLSFPLQQVAGAMLGSVVISADNVKRVAKELGHSPQEEVALLFIHGVLHLLGFDHEKDEGEMRKKEEELIKKFNLPKSLIVRNN